jgi:hypothetical protein
LFADAFFAGDVLTADLPAAADSLADLLPPTVLAAVVFAARFFGARSDGFGVAWRSASFAAASLGVFARLVTTRPVEPAASDCSSSRTRRRLALSCASSSA